MSQEPQPDPPLGPLPMRSPTFPLQERFARGVSPIGPVCYFDAGTEKDLPPLLLIHALGTDMTQWEHVAPVLAQHTRVIGLDLPGCGHSARPRRAYTLAEMAQAVTGLIGHLGLERVVLMGHSFGGRVAAEVTLTKATRAPIQGLVLMNSSGFMRWGRASRLAAKAFFRAPLVAPLITYGVGRVFGRIFATRNEHTDRFMQHVLDHPDARHAWDFAHYACPMVEDMMSDVLDRLDEFTLPVLVIWGERDQLLSYRQVPGWVRRLPQGKLLSLPNCGHMPNLEQPEALNQALLGFLQKLPQGAAAQRPEVAAAAGAS